MTENDGITDHIRAREEEHFRKKDRELIEKLRRADADAKARRALEKETGLHDPAMLAELSLLGFTPETIARKDRLVADIDAMLADPRPREADWRDALRAAIDDLDALERPFAPLDEHRFGQRPTRHRLIDDPRERWPWLAP